MSTRELLKLAIGGGAGIALGGLVDLSREKPFSFSICLRFTY